MITVKECLGLMSQADRVVMQDADSNPEAAALARQWIGELYKGAAKAVSNEGI